ncbi:MAG: hypothetical protein ACK47E_07350 [Cyclobacteriaceae bacterium]|jgi:hypothetical protein
MKNLELEKLGLSELKIEESTQLSGGATIMDLIRWCIANEQYWDACWLAVHC